MTHTIAAALYASFVALVAIELIRPPTDRSSASVRRSLLIGHVLFATSLAVTSQRDLWPFSAWQLMVGPAPAEIGDEAQRIRFMVRSESGAAFRLDHRAIEPLDLGEFRAWWRQYLPVAQPSVLDEACSFVLQQAEHARREVIAGGQPGYLADLLGPLTAGKHFLYRALWSSPSDVPSDAFVQVSVYTEHWTLEGRRRDPGALELRQVLTCEVPS